MRHSDEAERSGGFDRRQVLALCAATAFLTPGPAQADEIVGAVESAEGQAFAKLSETRRLRTKSEILLGDNVWTAENSRASIGLSGGTAVHLGPKAQLTIDRFIAESGGTLVLGAGALVFDRDDDLPKTSLQIRTTFGLIGVRGTRFFAGPSSGVFGVFVERGAVRVFAGGAERLVPAGRGVDIEKHGAAPSEVRTWGDKRIADAFSSVLG